MNDTKHASPQFVSPGSSQWAGKVVVIGVFVVALSAASFALWWNITRAKKSLEFWGKDSVRAIQHGKKVELMELKSWPKAESDQHEGKRFAWGEQEIQIAKTHDISGAHGLAHARHSLTDDSSFVWTVTTPAEQPNWTHAVSFDDDTTDVLILLDLTNRRLVYYNGLREVTIIPKISEGWQTYIGKQLKAKP
ncbi:hypothetical protein NA78x_001171 [Anatilimnocola sp. NA78]|uniref:hypothetical protein n=1 Tax=Anatilimnocola sp. NA78 TaxID=3415683 RepID=UPI003CE45988